MDIIITNNQNKTKSEIKKIIIEYIDDLFFGQQLDLSNEVDNFCDKVKQKIFDKMCEVIENFEYKNDQYIFYINKNVTNSDDRCWSYTDLTQYVLNLIKNDDDFVKKFDELFFNYDREINWAIDATATNCVEEWINSNTKKNISC